jgi:hypothetical protein
MILEQPFVMLQGGNHSFLMRKTLHYTKTVQSSLARGETPDRRPHADSILPIPPQATTLSLKVRFFSQHISRTKTSSSLTPVQRDCGGIESTIYRVRVRNT